MSRTIKPVSRLYYKGSQLCMNIPKQYFFHEDRNLYFANFIKDYMNVYIKTSYIESTLSSTHILNDVTLQEIELKQLFNIPVQEFVTISDDIDNPITNLFNDISSDYYYDNHHNIERENQVVHLNITNDTHEMYGYTKQLLDFSFTKK